MELHERPSIKSIQEIAKTDDMIITKLILPEPVTFLSTIQTRLDLVIRSNTVTAKPRQTSIVTTTDELLMVRRLGGTTIYTLDAKSTRQKLTGYPLVSLTPQEVSELDYEDILNLCLLREFAEVEGRGTDTGENSENAPQAAAPEVQAAPTRGRKKAETLAPVPVEEPEPDNNTDGNDDTDDLEPPF